jgi:elongation factor P
VRQLPKSNERPGLRRAQRHLTEPAGIRKWFVTMASTNDLKNGMVLNIEGQLWSVVEFQHVKPG